VVFQLPLVLLQFCSISLFPLLSYLGVGLIKSKQVVSQWPPLVALL
jgi:hypothetical protein